MWTATESAVARQPRPPTGGWRGAPGVWMTLRWVPIRSRKNLALLESESVNYDLDWLEKFISCSDPRFSELVKSDGRNPI
jgi:hypothetical protein